MFAPEQTAVENTWETEGNVEETVSEVVEILPEIDSENPDSTEAPILVTEEGEVDEMDQMVEVQLENWEIELVRLWDLNDSVQID